MGTVVRTAFLLISLIAIAYTDTVYPSEYVRPPASKDLGLRPPEASLGPHFPEQVHLALAGQGRVAVSWVTHPQADTTLVPAVKAEWEATQELEKKKKKKKKERKSKCQHLLEFPLLPTVQLGRASGKYHLNVSGSFTCYASSEYKSGALHTVILGSEAPLNPGEQYFYRTGDPQFGWGSEFNFTTPVPVSKHGIPYRLGLIGDLGQTEDSLKTLLHLNRLNVASVLNVGDLSYADSYQPRWDSWNRLLEFHAARVPWMHIEGNHELELLDGHKGFVAYETRYWFPSEESKSQSPFYYSYETGPLHVTMLGCYVDYLRDSEQAAWLKKDLAAVDRERTPWVIVGMHAPWYNSYVAHQGEVNDMRDDLESILYQFGVDIVFAGHVHAYERSKGGVIGGKLDRCAPSFVTIGDGGNREGLSTETLEQPEWSGLREPSFGMGTFTVENTTHAVWHWHRNKDNVTEIADEYWLTRNRGCQGGHVAEASPAADNAVLTS